MSQTQTTCTQKDIHKIFIYVTVSTCPRLDIYILIGQTTTFQNDSSRLTKMTNQHKNIMKCLQFPAAGRSKHTFLFPSPNAPFLSAPSPPQAFVSSLLYKKPDFQIIQNIITGHKTENETTSSLDSVTGQEQKSATVMHGEICQHF